MKNPDYHFFFMNGRITCTSKKEMKVAGHQGPVVRKPINANPRLKNYQGVCFSTLKCCITLIFGKILH